MVAATKHDERRAESTCEDSRVVDAGRLCCSGHHAQAACFQDGPFELDARIFGAAVAQELWLTRRGRDVAVSDDSVRQDGWVCRSQLGEQPDEACVLLR